MGDIVILHVHPDPSVKVRRVVHSLSCSEGCKDGRDGSVTIHASLSGWSGVQPVLIDGSEVNPFTSGNSIPITSGCGGRVISIIYDYVNPSYTIGASAYKKDSVGGASPFCHDNGYAEYTWDLRSKYGPGGIIELTSCCNSKSVSVKFGESSSNAGIAINYGWDHTKMQRYYPSIETYITTSSKVAIGRQHQGGGSIQQQRTEWTQGKLLELPEYDQDGKMIHPTIFEQIPHEYSITGPAVSFGKVASNVDIHLMAIQSPPVPACQGTAYVRTWCSEGYIVGVSLFFLNSDSGMGMSPYSGMLPCGANPILAVVKRNNLILIGNGTVMVSKTKPGFVDIMLGDLYITDQVTEGKVKVKGVDSNGDIQEGYVSSDAPYGVKYATPTGDTSSPNAFVQINEMIVTGICKFNQVIGSSITSYTPNVEFMGGALSDKYLVVLGFITGTSLRTMMKAGPDDPNSTNVTVSDVYTSNGAQIPNTDSNGYTTKLLVGKEADGSAVNYAVHTPVGKAPDKTDEALKELMGNNYNETSTPYSNDKTDNSNGSGGGGGNAAPVNPYEQCIISSNGYVSSDDPFPDPPDKDDDIDGDDIEDDKEVFAYKIESQAVIIDSTVMRLFNVQSSIAGFDGDDVTVGYSYNVKTIGTVKYTAISLYGIICICPDGTSAGVSATIDREAYTIKFHIGSAPTGSKIVLLGGYDKVVDAPLTGKLVVVVNPADAFISASSVGSGYGPIFTSETAPGSVDVTASANGYIPSTVTGVVIKAGETTQIAINLVKVGKPNKVTFNISSTYLGADVIINGQNIGSQTPTTYTMYKEAGTQFVSYNIKCVSLITTGTISRVFIGYRGVGVGGIGDIVVDVFVVQVIQ